MILSLYIILTHLSMFEQPIILDVLLGLILSFFWLSIGFNAMHDAARYAFFKSPKLNKYVSKIWNAFSTRSHASWLYHHVLFHHSFTNTARGADIYHFIPFFQEAHIPSTGVCSTTSIPSSHPRIVPWSSSTLCDPRQHVRCHVLEYSEGTKE